MLEYSNKDLGFRLFNLRQNKLSRIKFERCAFSLVKRLFFVKRFKTLSLMGELFHFSCEIFYQSPRPSLKRRVLFSDSRGVVTCILSVIFSHLPRTLTWISRKIIFHPRLSTRIRDIKPAPTTYNPRPVSRVISQTHFNDEIISILIEFIFCRSDNLL